MHVGARMPTPLEKGWQVREYTQEHACLTFGLGPRSPITDMSYLSAVAQKFVASDNSTTPEQLRSYIAGNMGASISYHQAWKCLQDIRESRFGSAAES